MKNQVKQIIFIGCLTVCLVAAFLSLSLSTPGAFAQEKDIDQIYQTALDNEQSIGQAIRFLVEEIERREKVYSTDCDLVRETISRFLQSERDLSNALEELMAYYDGLLRKIQNHLEPFNKLIEEFEALKAEAAWAGLLVPVDVWDEYLAVRGEGGLTDDVIGPPGTGKKVRKFQERESRIAYVDWTEALEQYRKDIGKEVEDANSAWENRLESLVGLYAAYDAYTKQIKDFFQGGKYEHCLGELASRYPMSMHYGTLFSDPGATDAQLSDIPGMEFEFPKLAAFQETSGSFAAPVEPAAPPPLHYFMDPVIVPERFAQRAEARLEGERIELKIEVWEAVIYTTEVLAQLDVRKMYMNGIYNPMYYNLTDTSKSLGEAVSYAGYDIVKGLTWDAVVGIVDAGVKLSEEAYKGANAVGIEFTPWGGVDGVDLIKSAIGLCEAFIDVAQGSAETMGKIKAVLDNAPRNDPERPRADASPGEWLRYTEALNARADSTADSVKEVKETVEWYNEHVVDNANRVLQIYLAFAGAKAAYKVGGAWGTAKSLTGLDNLESAAALGKAGKNIWKKRVGGIKEALKKSKTAREIIARSEDLGHKIPDDVLKIVKENADPGASVRKKLDELELGEKISKKKKDSLNDMQKAQQKAAERTKPFVKTGEIDMGGGKKIELGQELGRGTYKKVYEHVDKSKVVQHIEKDTANVLRRERLGFERLKEVGVDTVKVHGEEVLADGTAVRVVERVDPKSIGENILEESNTGKFNPEQQAAVADALHKINESGYIWTDPNPGNFSFFRDKAGKLKIKIIDTDGIVKIDNVLKKENGATLELADKKLDTVSFDLTKKADIARLQRAIAVGDQIHTKGAFGKANSDKLAEHLATQEFTGNATTVPRSIGSLSEAIPDGNKLAVNGIDAALEDGRKAALSETLAEDSGFQEFVESQNRYERVDQNSIEVFAKEQEILNKLEQEEHIYLSRKKPAENGTGEVEGDTLSQGDLDDLLSVEGMGGMNIKLPEIDFENFGEQGSLLY